MGEGGSTKTLHWSISLFSKMGDKGEGEFKNVKKNSAGDIIYEWPHIVLQNLCT